MAQRLGRTATDLDYGLGEHLFDSDELGLIGEDELTQRLVATFSSPSYKPPRLPTVATELLAQSQNPDVEFSEIEELLERDAMLAGEVLSLARSAFYARQRPPDNLKDALVLIGLTKLREVVLEAALTMRVFRSATYADHMQRLGDHSRATAHLARLVSRQTPIGEEQAFLCGLLHDVGLGGILLVLGEAGRNKKPPHLDVLWPAIHRAHPQAGARIAELWQLPTEVSQSISAHHEVSIGGEDHPLAAVACIAESLAIEVDRGFAPPFPADGDEDALCEVALLNSLDRTNPAVVRRAAETLGIAEETLEGLRSDARDWITLIERAAPES